MTVLNLASERCVATDEICVKGVRGCFLDKRFIGSCVMQEPINFARVGTAVPCLPSLKSQSVHTPAVLAIRPYSRWQVPFSQMEIGGNRRLVY